MAKKKKGFWGTVKDYASKADEALEKYEANRQKARARSVKSKKLQLKELDIELKLKKKKKKLRELENDDFGDSLFSGL